jgi:oligoribonuclease NrnB/cAMP/cGMP phosphodiesterase (DHH superfamily)
MKPIVIYHGNCQDGFTAAWAIWKVHPDWDFYPGKYQEDPPDVTDRVVYFVDFSYKRPVILEMAKKAQDITILDHHKSAEADLVDLPSNVFVHFDTNKSGARLAWEHFHSSEKAPPLLLRVEDRDLWRFRYEDTKDVSAYLFSQNYEFETWDYMMRLSTDEHDLDEMAGYGYVILLKQAKDIDELLQNKFKIVLGGTEVWTANLPYTLCSEAGNILSQGEPFSSTFYLDGQSAIFSLRSDEDGVDVSEIAKQYGGGGHKHAAGFKVPFSFAYFMGVSK